MAEDKGFWKKLFGKGKDKPGPDNAAENEAEPTPPPAPPLDGDRPQDGPAKTETEATDPARAEPADDETKQATDATDQADADESAEQPGEQLVVETEQLKTDAVGRVYAGALLELTSEQGSTDAVADEVSQLLAILAEGGDLHQLFSNPGIGDQDRKQIVKKVFEGKVSDLLLRFLCVVADKGRLDSLPSIAAGYLLAVAEQRGQVEVEAFVAAPLDAQTAEQVAGQIGAHLGKQVTLRQHVDASLIGGLKIKIGDKLIDASVASQLKSMKNKMIAAGRG